MENNQQSGPQFEQKMVNELAREMLSEQRATRRWNTAFKVFIALYLLVLLIMAIYNSSGLATGNISSDGHTALVEINGVISASSEANADYVITGLRNAFENENTKGVIIRINSPGGSPVQAGYINDEIMRLKKEYPDTPVYAVITDICASGGYYIAAAADQIYADKASIVGSIGVIMAGFGFVDAIEKLGIERRVLHAGDNKALMDPFSPLQAEEVKHFDGLLKEVHQQFIDVVKEGRGDKLDQSADLFTGLVWTGQDAINLGLVDELSSSSKVAREVIEAEDIIDFTFRESYLDQFTKNLGAAIYNAFVSNIGFR